MNNVKLISLLILFTFQSLTSHAKIPEQENSTTTIEQRIEKKITNAPNKSKKEQQNPGKTYSIIGLVLAVLTTVSILYFALYAIIGLLFTSLLFTTLSFFIHKKKFPELGMTKIMKFSYIISAINLALFTLGTLLLIWIASTW